MKPELLVNYEHELGEGPLWDERSGSLYWVNIYAGEVHCLSLAEGSHDVHTIGQPVGAVAFREGGGLLLAVEKGFATYDLETKTLTPLAQPIAEDPTVRFNDGKVAPNGHFLAGTLAYDLKSGAGKLYRLSPDGAVAVLAESITISNGLAWSADGRTLYYVDTIPGMIYAFDYDLDSGDVHRKRVVVDCHDQFGGPDGMTIDRDGMLWTAHFGGGLVCRWQPGEGKLLERIELPVTQPTSCTFGGPNLDTLFITSAWEGMDADKRAADPLAGALFAVKTPYQGYPVHRFAA